MRRTSFLAIAVIASAACSDPEAPDTTGGGGSGGGATSTDAPSSSSATTGGADSSGGSDSAGGSGGAGGDGGSGGEGGSGGKPPTCEPYPVPLSFPDAQPAAIADLQSFAPGASLSWSAPHGTLSLVTGLGVTLDCSSNDVWASAWSFFAEHPDLFQLDQSEWPTEPVFPCSAVTSSQIVNTYRQELAGEEVRKDVLAIFVAPENGEVHLNAVSGFYLPPVSPDDIQDCAELPDDAIEEIIREASFTFSTFSQCSPTGSGIYVPQPDDVVELDGSWWEWEDPPGGVTARRVRTVRLVIDESNVTSQLVASDANCPDDSSDGRIYGFTIRIDPITGEILDVKPGIGCIVC